MWWSTSAQMPSSTVAEIESGANLVPYQRGSECYDSPSPAQNLDTPPASPPGFRIIQHGRETAAKREWNQHREHIIQLYWDRDLPLNEVQDHMKRERGFEKSVKAYKRQLKNWGVRKNIRKDEAVQLASGKAVSKFWPDQRGQEYHRRVVRHLSGVRGEATRSSWERRRLACGVNCIPAQFTTRDIVAAVESALFYGDVFLQGMRRPGMVSMLHKPETRDNEMFFELFAQGIEDVAQNRQSRLAFANLNSAFDHLKGLLTADHPITYYRLIGNMLSCRTYPTSEIAGKVCRMLATHCLQLSRVVLGPRHPLNHWWMTAIKLIDSRQWEHFEHFLESAQRMGSRYIAYVPGMVDLIAYVPSDMRGLKDEVLRAHVEELSRDGRRVSEAQEARLCLAELLLGQGAREEGVEFVTEALSFKDLDPVRPASKAFWMSELFWRAGELDDSLALLQDARDHIMTDDEISHTDTESSPELTELQILTLLRHKLEWLDRRREAVLVDADTPPPTLGRRDLPRLHIMSGDLDNNLDQEYHTLLVDWTYRRELTFRSHGEMARRHGASAGTDEA